MTNAYAERYRILPVEATRTTLTVATAEPFVRDWADELEKILKVEVKLVFANPQDIRRYLGEFYNLARSMKKAQEASKGEVSLARNFEQLVALGQQGTLDANDSHVVHIVDWLWQYAFEQRASDIHVEPRRDAGIVRFRIDGVLHQVYAIPTPVLVAMTSRIKLLARMEIVEKRRPQDGRIKTVAAGGEEVELRISTMPTAFGEKVVMRIFTPEVLVRDFIELGFTADDRDRWGRMIKEPNGIILVTGPTGSGKTTTLYSSLKQLATPEVNVCTVEDPIEMIEPMFNQMQVQTAIGVDFAHGVRTLMRQDPDIIMVGEIRDRDTADMAIQAALTGHLVLSSLHTNDAPDRRDADARSRDAGLPDQLDAAGRHGAAPGAHAVPALQEARRAARRRDVAGDHVAVAGGQAGAGDGAGGLRRVPDDGLPRAHRPLRDHADDAGDEEARHRARRRREDPRAGLQGRHEAAARLRRDESRGRSHHGRRGREGRAAGVAATVSPRHSPLPRSGGRQIAGDALCSEQRTRNCVLACRTLCAVGTVSDLSTVRRSAPRSSHFIRFPGTSRRFAAFDLRRPTVRRCRCSRRSEMAWPLRTGQCPAAEVSTLGASDTAAAATNHGLRARTC